MKKNIVVTGGAGFIGTALVNYLKKQGHWVRSVDIKKSDNDSDEYMIIDLREEEYAHAAVSGIEDKGSFWKELFLFKNTIDTHPIDEVYHLASDVGGQGYISKNHSSIMRNNLLIDINILEAAKNSGIKKLLYTSSACVYPNSLQKKPNFRPLKESDAYPCDLENDAYGWEKLTIEQLCRHYRNEYKMDIKISRFQNIFGPGEPLGDDREKVTAALCRKVFEAKEGDYIEIWGDGKQTRDFMYIDDCVKGLVALMGCNYRAPINIASKQVISVNDLALMVSQIANKLIHLKHIDGPEGSRGKRADNTLREKVLDWKPTTSLYTGMEELYNWTRQEIALRRQHDR